MLETPRLILEPVTPAHADEAWPGLDDERMWTFFPQLRPGSLEQLRATFERRARGSGDATQIWLNFECRARASRALIGEVQATILVRAGASYVAYGVYVREQGKGYAREAVRALIDHVAKEYGIRRFLAEIDAANARSIALIEALTFELAETNGGECLYEFTFRKCRTRRR